MTIKGTMTGIAAAALGAVVLVAALPSAGFAQLSDKPVRTVKPDQGGATTAKPVKPIQRSAAPNARTTEPQARQWTLQDAMPDHSASMRQYDREPIDRSHGLGRVPLQSGPGSFGITTDNKVKSNQLPDGQRIPGLDSTSRQNPSYVGLSLSVPTSDKALNIPVPFGAPW
jgi:hypothetical protein